MKEYRAIATRYDKQDTSYAAGIAIYAAGIAIYAAGIAIAVTLDWFKSSR